MIIFFIKKMIIKLPNGKYQLASKITHRNLGIFNSINEAKKHER